MIKKNITGSIIDPKKSFGEKCGIVGVWSEDPYAPYYIRKGLSTLQHRGQESAGISIYTPGNKIKTYTGMGLVPNVLTTEVLKNLGGCKAAIGHNRYSTAGSTGSCNAQPITLEKGNFQLSIGHNGNIPDYTYLGEQLDKKFQEDDTSDTQLIAKLLLQERFKFSDWDNTLKNVLPRIQGAFCFIIMTQDGSIYGARDNYGIRPFCLGKMNNGWIMASESVALDLNGAEFLRDIKPGEIVKIDYNGNLSSFFFGEPKKPQNCIFEYIYFSRPDSFENGIRVRQARETSGKYLGQRILKKGIKADYVIPVFDSGYPAAKGAAHVLGMHMVDAITVSHYIGRTFIQPGQENRMAAVNGKHNIIPDEIFGKRVIVVDDSAVRLTTSKKLCKGLRDAGVKEVYMVFASPPVVKHCDLGIDMKSRKELPASLWADEPFEVIEENVAKFIGADGVVYLPIEELSRALGSVKENFYHYPFGGPHPIRDRQHEFPKLKKKISPKPKICVFISGNGTFLADIIKGIERKEIDAEIISIVSNKKDAAGLTLARKSNLPIKLIEYEGKISDKTARKKYDQKILEYTKSINPELILLSGWQMILGEIFLKELQYLQIPVINHHPALLTSNNSNKIATSRGIIPVMRGAHVLRESFNKKIPVSGISVHQVLPGDNFDVGPVIMKAEVRLRPQDSYESWKKRMDETEHLLLPSAVKRVIHVIKSGIDISKGDFYW